MLCTMPPTTVLICSNALSVLLAQVTNGQNFYVEPSASGSIFS